jgi:two-component system sensor histidine kinase ResE
MNSNVMIYILILISVTLYFVAIYLYKKNKSLSHGLIKVKKENDYIHNARDNLLRSVNHELRAPLSRMKIDIEMVKDDEIRASLDEDANYMQCLIDELMEIEKIRITQIEKEDIDLNLLVDQVITKLKLDRKNIILETIADQVNLLGNPPLIEKLCKNLIENAFKYKDNDGLVRIKISDEGDRVQLNVMNEGSYIESKDIPFLFEPFYRVDKSRTPGKDGLGLGLNICKEIATSHNGKVQVSSKKDLGTTFKVTLQK